MSQTTLIVTATGAETRELLQRFTSRNLTQIGGPDVSVSGVAVYNAGEDITTVWRIDDPHFQASRHYLDPHIEQWTKARPGRSAVFTTG